MIEVNKIYNEDCLETMARMPDGFVDLTVTSPPYNFDLGSHIGHKYNGKIKDKRTQNEYYEWQSNCIEKMIRVSKLTFYNIQMIAGNKDALFLLMGKFYKNIKEVIIWDKIYSEPAMSPNVMNSQFEFIIVFGPDNKRKFDKCNFSRGTLGNVFYIKKNKFL